MITHRLLLAAVVALGTGAAPAMAAPAALGACAGCHDLSAARHKVVGPPLFGVYGAKPMTKGIPFAKWNQSTLDKWLSGPSTIKPGTLMTFQVTDPKQRGEVIAALKHLK